MADIAEERGLRAIDCRQRFGALPLGLVGAGVGERRRELVGDEIEKAPVARVERTLGIDADDEPSLRPAGGRGDRQRRDEIRPGAGEALLGVRRGRLQPVSEVGEGERDIGFRGQGVDGEGARVALRPGGGIVLGEIAKQGEAPLADHPFRRFGHDAEHAADRARFVAHRIVGHVEVGFLDEPVAFELEEEIARPERFTGSHDAVEQRMELTLPDLAPGFAAGTSERVGVLRTEDGPIGVVVQDDGAGSPEEHDLRFRRQEHADRAAQALRPRLWRAERGRAPVHLAHPPAHFAAAGKECQERGIEPGLGRPRGHGAPTFYGVRTRSNGRARTRERLPRP